MSRSIITLTTDFGSADAYVASVKGVVLGTNPDATIVDVSHDVPPHDVNHGAYVLASAAPYFPPGAVHVCVVDPGVGTKRRGLALSTPSAVYVGPDNGVFTYVVLAGLDRRLTAERFGPPTGEFMEPVKVPLPEGYRAYELSDSRYWRRHVSDTFHGRDVFAPVAAHLSLSMSPADLGAPVNEVVCLNVHPPSVRKHSVEGRTIFVDRFGNLVTNIKQSHVRGDQVQVTVGDAIIGGISTAFADADGLVSLIGSQGYLEIAENLGSAAQRLGAGVGAGIEVRE